MTDITLFFQGITISGFLVFSWLPTLDAQTKETLNKNYAKYIKKELSTQNGMTVTLSDIKKGLDFAAKNPSGGKALIQIGKWSKLSIIL